MHAWIRRAVCAVGITGGLVLLGFGLAEAASADNSGPVTTGQSAILSGNQTGVDAQAPINLSGNQVTVIGQDNTNTSTGAATTTSHDPGSPTTSGQNGIGSGNQTGVDVQAPVNASGNQVTVIGQHNTTQAAGASSTAGGGQAGGSGDPTTSGQNGIASGNQTAIGVQAPINASGNQITVIGQDNTTHSVAGTATGGSGPATTSGSPTTTGQSGILSGNQTGIALTAPINLSGNQITVIGQDNDLAALGGSSTPASGGGAAGSPTTSGQSGIGSGNQTGIGVAVPVNVSGNQVTVIGQDNTLGSLGASSTSGGGGSAAGGSPTTSGENGILSGNQTGISIGIPVTATGNQATVIGQDNTLTSVGGSSTGGSSTGGGTTTGEGGIGSGNQTPIQVQVPVDASGNQVTVVGQGNTNTSTGGDGGTPGGTTPGGGVVSPPGGVVSPPSGSTSTNVSQGVSAPGTTVLPSTGMPGGIELLALLGLVLVALGGGMTRRRSLAVPIG